jgi:hypothetical protein
MATFIRLPPCRYAQWSVSLPTCFGQEGEGHLWFLKCRCHPYSWETRFMPLRQQEAQS